MPKDNAARRPTLLELEIGHDAARKVMEAAGGERLYVPRDHSSGGRLCALVGHDVATLLIDRLGDSRFYVPRATNSRRLDGDAVERLDEEHQSATQIARTLGCSVRAVPKARARTRASRYVRGRTSG